MADVVIIDASDMCKELLGLALENQGYSTTRAAPDVPGGANLPERAQLCAQVLLLRAHGYECDHGEIYFARSRRRVRIEIDEELIEITLRAVARARDLVAAVDLFGPCAPDLDAQ